MAFHVACPITCRKICFCVLGLPRRLQSKKCKNDYLQEVARVDLFLNDPWLTKARENATIQVKVPKVVVSPAPPPLLPAAPAVAVGDEEATVAASAPVKRLALHKHAAAASVEAEDYARRFESGDLLNSAEDAAGEGQGHSNVNVMCRLCFHGEIEGSERARKMPSCNSCGKKYHRNCVKVWSQNRDLFHWSSWNCPSCRTCEVCRRTGGPNKFMFCKRCDAAHHCYCQQPPHKNVGHGPYLCPKHTKCHSCDSSVPGNGLSVRWFLGYTCCDACGRLFVKNNYCPVCLKVYRDSESTPMVCCDICQKWVHCPCDEISDAKYKQFQADGNLQYVCPTCRGECGQIRSLEEAVQELWRRRDEADRDLIASLRAAAGLPTQDNFFDTSPFSDDEEGAPLLLKNEHGQSLKFSLKGVGDNSPRKSKEYGKKSSNKMSGKKKGNKTSYRSVAHQSDGSVFGYNTGDYRNDEMQLSSECVTFSPVAGGLTEGVCSVNVAAMSKHKYIEKVTADKPSRTIRIKSNKTLDLTNKDDSGTYSNVPKIAQPAQGPKLVIHLGARSRSTTTPPRSEASIFNKGQILASSNGHTKESVDQVKSSKLRENDGHLIKLKNSSPEVSNTSSKLSGGKFADGYESKSPTNAHSLLGKRRIEDIESPRSESEVWVSKRNKYSSKKYSEDGPTVSGKLIDDNRSIMSISQASEKDRKPNLKFKIPKNPNNVNQISPSNLNSENHSPLPLPGKGDITYSKGQRSKRRRPTQDDEDASQWGEDNSMKDFMDANWILQKLGKDAAGKRVEIHQPFNDSWHRGTVVEVFESTSIVSVVLDDGEAKNYELGKQGIRFVPQKQRR
ncbi:hypothetical protein ACJIZ3_016358 [Penstemon smallii]|uniref:Uncharacterized protein n=1 Tax=Penstemon smallii TaxID=265156 RepID=A0ABD3RQ62_9LAMI